MVDDCSSRVDEFHGGRVNPPFHYTHKARTLLPGSTIALKSHSGGAVLGTLGMTHWLSPLNQAAEMAIASEISAALLKRSQYRDPVVPGFKRFAHMLQIRALRLNCPPPVAKTVAATDC